MYSLLANSGSICVIVADDSAIVPALGSTSLVLRNLMYYAKAKFVVVIDFKIIFVRCRFGVARFLVEKRLRCGLILDKEAMVSFGVA